MTELSAPRIVCAAVQLGNGLIVPSARHFDMTMRLLIACLAGDREEKLPTSQLPLLAGWTITEGDYAEGPTSECTWLIDPPYVDKGKFYRQKFTDHAGLGRWCKTLQGQTIVLEGAGADWLPFQSLGDFKTSLGKSEEKVWLRDCGYHPFGAA
jgi:hypothetical protein